MKKDWDKQGHKLYLGMPRQGGSLLLVVALLSLLIHVLTMTNISEYVSRHSFSKPKTPIKVKISYAEKKPDKKIDKSKPDSTPAERMVETHLDPTKELPKAPKFNGAQDHFAEHETKVKKTDNADAKLNPGHQDGKTDSVVKEKKVKQTEKVTEKQDKVDPLQHLKKTQKEFKATEAVTAPGGKVSISSVARQPRNAYESMMPTQDEMSETQTKGYVDNLSDDIASGDKIDLNTTNYRYIGYMSGFRKQLYMVWTYPGEAVRRGLEGTVICEFTIVENGQVKNIIIKKSSGYHILDQAVIDALKLGSPYAPLPATLPKKPMTIVGSFSYALTGYAGN